ARSAWPCAGCAAPMRRWPRAPIAAPSRATRRDPADVIRVAALAGGLLLAVWFGWPDGVVRHPPGPGAPREPVQSAAADPTAFAHGAFRLQRLAAFAIEARVLGHARYWLARDASLSPIDLALGWGPMSDQAVLDRVEVTQSGRWYYWRTSGPPP